MVVQVPGPGGEPQLVIERAGASHRLRLTGVGEYLLTGEGQLVCTPVDRERQGEWQRFLTAQVLPLAAVLDGLEALHASAVVVRERVVAFPGRSGSGKSSATAHLVARGARLFSDDVVTLAVRSGTVYAHPALDLLRVLPSALNDAAFPAAGPGRGRLGPGFGHGHR